MESPVASGSRHATFPPSSSSSATRKREEDIVYLFEAEEERITNLLSRKLERLKEEKVELENLLEAENESHVNRLTREISALRAMNAQQSGGAVDENGTSSTQAQANGNGAAAFPLSQPNVMLDAMRRENEELRSRLVTAEQGRVFSTNAPPSNELGNKGVDLR
ncbi:hypothetical protein FRB99_001228 [Tulasnella sp. 403]|nr:hypothetical protein FRB99_001228 [Tulasnella sp. 403]